MTLLVSWIGIDTHGPTSAYIVSDSRITWKKSVYFDYGKKVFSSKKYPEIFGYAGDVLFPTIVLSQIIEMIDSGVLFNESMSCEKKNKIVFQKLQHMFTKYPGEYGGNPIQIIHISRETLFDGYPKFHHFILTWNKNKGWKHEEKSIPNESGLLQVLGSGKEEFNNNYERYQKGKNQSTSRNVFHCFIDTLFNIQDYNCGGAPQLVGIYRKPFSVANNYGIIYNKKKYFLGTEIPKGSSFENVEWRNENFELCDGNTLKRKNNAQIQIDDLRRK